MTRAPRVGIFVIRFPKLSETFIVTKVLKLLDAGFDVQIFALAQSTDWDAFEVLAGRDDVRARIHLIAPVAPMSRALVEGGVDMIKAAAAHPGSFARYLSHTWKTRGERRIGFLKSLFHRLHFVGQQLDILHIEFDAQGLGIADLKDYLGCHVLLSGRGSFHHMFAGRELDDACDYLFRYADGYHFISGFLDDNMRRLGMPNDLPTWRIEPAIDLTLFKPPPRPARSGREPLRIISVGRIEWTKGYEHALDAIARVRDRGIAIDYTIYGDGEYSDAVRYAIRQLRLDRVVHLAGRRKREQMPSAYANADIMVHAAVAEGFCNAVVEAQAMELPVVTSDSGGLPENVEHGVTGFVVPRLDPEAMAVRITELARSPDLIAKMGRAGRQRALARFDLDQQAQEFIRLYRELAALPIRPTHARKRNSASRAR